MSRIRASDLFSADGRRLIALETVSVDCFRECGIHGLQARLELCAVIAFEAGACRALAPDGGELALAELARRHPELPTLLPEAFAAGG